MRMAGTEYTYAHAYTAGTPRVLPHPVPGDLASCSPSRAHSPIVVSRRAPVWQVPRRQFLCWVENTPVLYAATQMCHHFIECPGHNGDYTPAPCLQDARTHTRVRTLLKMEGKEGLSK